MGIGESGRPRKFWKLQIVGSNPATRTICLVGVAAAHARLKNERILLNPGTRYHFDVEDYVMMFKYVIVAVSPEDHKKIEAQNKAIDAGEDIGDGIPVQILHAALYYEEPSEDAIEALYAELETDETFGLTQTPLVLLEAPKNVAKYFLNEVYGAMSANDNVTSAGYDLVPNTVGGRTLH